MDTPEQCRDVVDFDHYSDEVWRKALIVALSRHRDPRVRDMILSAYSQEELAGLAAQVPGDLLSILIAAQGLSANPPDKRLRGITRDFQQHLEKSLREKERLDTLLNNVLPNTVN